jgi:putative endonuclease
MLLCGDGSFYTGIAKDVHARVKQHSEGRGATYTRTRLPVKLLYQQAGLTHSEALIREAQIKALPRSKKEDIIFSGHRMEPFTPAGANSGRLAVPSLIFTIFHVFSKC